MTTPQIAQGLAGLGRNGDSVLVHMQPDEVAGLQSLAKANGTSLTINPDTGMPEAFSVSNFLKSMLPWAAGAALAPMTGGTSLAFMGTPLGAGLTGAGARILSGGSLQEGLMTGLSMAGGASFGQGIMGAGANAAPAASNVGDLSSVIPNADKFSAAQLTNEANAATAAGLQSAAPQSTAFWQGVPNTPSSDIGSTLATAAPSQTSMASQLSQAPMSGYDQFGQGLKSIANAESPWDAYKNVIGAKSDLGAFGKTASVLGPAALAGIEPPKMMSEEELKAQRMARAREPLNLNYDTGLRLAAGGAIQSGGVMDLYQGTDSQPTFGGDQGYGLGRLNSLAQQQSMTNAESGRFAKGGVPRLEDGGFVVPADVTFYMGNHNTEAGQERLAQMYGGQPIKGKGTGLSDSIPTSIEGKQPARIANGEVYIPRKAVMAHGGPEKFYKMMDKVRKKATGSTKQAKSA